MPANKTRPPTVNNQSIETLEQDTISLSARILLKLIADPERQDKMLAIARQALLEESGKGLMKRISGGLSLRLLPMMLNMLTKKVPPENPAPDIGRLLTTWLIIKNRRAQNGPAAGDAEQAQRVAETMDAFLTNLDIGELYHAIDSIHDQTLITSDALVKLLKDGHLGKMAALGPTGVSAANLLLAVLNGGLRHLHDIPPDFIAGFLAGLIDLLDANALGELINHQNELSRMLHIGDLLQGDGKTSALEGAIANKSREVFPKLDPTLLTKKIVGQAELSATIKKSQRRALSEYPELTRAVIAGRALSANARLKTVHETLKLLTEMPEETAAQSLADAIGAINTYELSEIIGLALALLKTIRNNQPGVIGKWLTGIVKALDDDDLTVASETITQEAVDALKPLAAAVIPSLVGGLCDLMAESLDDEPAKAGPVFARLFDILKSGQSAPKVKNEAE